MHVQNYKLTKNVRMRWRLQIPCNVTHRLQRPLLSAFLVFSFSPPSPAFLSCERERGTQYYSCAHAQNAAAEKCASMEYTLLLLLMAADFCCLHVSGAGDNDT